jgi:hypothetical protein
MRRHSINQLVLDLDRGDTTMSSAPAPDGLLPALAELLASAPTGGQRAAAVVCHERAVCVQRCGT